MDPKLAKWLRWLKVIHDEVQQLLVAKRTFWEVQKIIKSNPKLHQPNGFYSYLGGTYVSHVVIGLRRQLKSDNQSISMARLMPEMIDSPHVLSRKYYVGLYKGSVVEHLADSDFDKFSEAGAPHIKASTVCTDRAQLRKAAQTCEDFADKRVAHRDKGDPKTLPTFNDLDASLDLLDHLYTKYHLMFHAANMETLLPVRQYDWQVIFREKWIP